MGLLCWSLNMAEFYLKFDLKNIYITNEEIRLAKIGDIWIKSELQNKTLS